MNDIMNKEDVKVFVDLFYKRVSVDEIIGPVFAAKIPDGNWEPHLKRMYSFWNTILFSVKEYSGNPFSKHANLPIEKRHFDRWVSLFSATIDELFEGEKAEEVKSRALQMGLLFNSKLEYIRSNKGYKNIM